MDKAERNKMVLDNMGLVGMVVKQYIKKVNQYSHIDIDDLVSIGTIGLIQACDRFDPERGVQFSTFAVPYIWGTVNKFLRNNVDMLHFTRQVKADYYKIIEFDLINEKPEEISKQLDMPICRVKEALEYYKNQNIKSLDEVILDNNGRNPVTVADTIGTEIDMDSNIEVERFLNSLDEKTRKVVNLRLQDLTQREIAQIVGLSQAEISRTLGRAKKKFENSNEGEMIV